SSTSPDVSLYWISAIAMTGTSLRCARLCPARQALKAAATKARPIERSFIGVSMIGLFHQPRVRDRHAFIWCRLSLQQAALDQPAGAAAPGRIGACAQIGLFDVDQRAGSGVANLVGHRVIRPADAGDDPDHRLV